MIFIIRTKRVFIYYCNIEEGRRHKDEKESEAGEAGEAGEAEGTADGW